MGDVIFSGWREQWLDRTHEVLYLETSLVACAIGILTIVVSGFMLRTSISCLRAIKDNPSDRAAIFAKDDKRMLKGSRAVWYLSHVYLYHALAVWLIDAAIGIFTIAQDVDANPENYDARLWIELAAHSVVMLGIFMSVFIIFPAFQMVGIGYLMARFYRRNSTDGTLAAYMTPARVLSSWLAHLWSMLGFLIVAWWPVFESTTIRIILLEAVFGSAITWLHASYLFNFRSYQFESVEVQENLGVSDGFKIYANKVYAAHTEKRELRLPQHEAVSETAPLLNEKAGQ